MTGTSGRFVIGAAVLLGLLAACSPADPAADTTDTTDITASSTMTSENSTDDDTSDEIVAAVPRTTRLSYGAADQQFGDLTVPSDGPSVVVVLIHGGFWRNPYDLGLMEPLAADLVERGYAVWNIEYRRLGDDGGGWPGTLDDVAAAIDRLATTDEPIDLDRVAFVGHSAGGHLALWAAGRASLPTGAPGADPAVIPVVGVGQGAVVDLAGASAARLGTGAVDELLGGAPSDHPDRYEAATPGLTAGPTMVSVVGSDDTIVPPAFSADPRQVDAIEVVRVEGADHFDLIDPSHAAWLAVVEQLDAALAP